MSLSDFPTSRTASASPDGTLLPGTLGTNINALGVTQGILKSLGENNFSSLRDYARAVLPAKQEAAIKLLGTPARLRYILDYVRYAHSEILELSGSGAPQGENYKLYLHLRDNARAAIDILKSVNDYLLAHTASNDPPPIDLNKLRLAVTQAALSIFPYLDQYQDSPLVDLLGSHTTPSQEWGRLRAAAVHAHEAFRERYLAGLQTENITPDQRAVWQKAANELATWQFRLTIGPAGADKKYPEAITVMLKSELITEHFSNIAQGLLRRNKVASKSSVTEVCNFIDAYQASMTPPQRHALREGINAIYTTEVIDPIAQGNLGWRDDTLRRLGEIRQRLQAPASTAG